LNPEAIALDFAIVRPFRRPMQKIFQPKRRGYKRVLAIAALLVAAAVGAAAWLEPALGATACPICYGFDRLKEDVYVDNRATDEQRESARAIVMAAAHRIASFYGEQRSAPRLFLCTTQECYDGFGGSARGVAILDVVLVLAPLGFNDVIATHELSHVEMHHRLGRLDTLRRAIPQWFDEGVAAIVSQDPRYPSDGTDQECAEAMQGVMPSQRGEWIHDAGHAALYAKAARRVGCWMHGRGGAAAVTGLIDKVAAGMPFDEAYR
jgi:hypothetical protein